MTELRGIYPMLFAFFGKDGKLDRKAMKRQVDAMVEARVHGIAVLGLATESNKLSLKERQDLLAWVAEDLAGRLPLSVTIPGPNAMEQVALARHAKACGARWLILQPPPVTGVSESALVRYFAEVLAEIDQPVGLQIAPQYLGSGLSPAGALALGDKFPQLKILKVEMSGYGAAVLAQEVGHRFAIFNGQDGVDLVDTLRGGCAGCIPGAEFADILARIYDGLMNADEGAKAAAETRYLRLAPALSFLMASMDRFLVYGKRVMCDRLDLPADNRHVRSPCGLVDVQGEAIVSHWAGNFGRFGSEL